MIAIFILFMWYCQLYFRAISRSIVILIVIIWYLYDGLFIFLFLYGLIIFDSSLMMGLWSLYFDTVWIFLIAMRWATGHFIWILFCSSNLGSRSVHININNVSWVIGSSISIDLVASTPTSPTVSCWWLRCYMFPLSAKRDFQIRSCLHVHTVCIILRAYKQTACVCNGLVCPRFGNSYFFASRLTGRTL